MSMLIQIESNKFDLESLVTFFCENPKIEGVVAIHSTKLGPAMGGCRVYDRLDMDLGVQDAVKLAKAMTYKNALVDLPYGGGKAVIIKHEIPLNKVMPYFAKVMNLLNGSYLTTEDVGTNDKDMDFLRKYTKHVIEEPILRNFIPSAAFGLYQVIKATVLCYENRNNISNLRVGVQGLGKVGFNLCRFLYNEGCELYVCDIKKDLEELACKEFNAKVFRLNEINKLALDIFSPCALGNVITEHNYLDFNTKYIICGANNPLSHDIVSDLLYKNEVIYIPDFLSNAGGVLEAKFEDPDFEYNQINIFNRIKDIICYKTTEILTESMRFGLPPLQVAKNYVHKRLSI